VDRIVRTFECRLGRACVWASCVVVFCLFSAALNAQTPDPAPETERPVPILTGNTGFFTNVNGGQTELVPSITPVLLVPLGDRWLVESRAEFTGQFERPDTGGAYGGKVEKEIDYLQLDYIANRYLTVTAGRFLTPFGIYNERLYPIWIRSLQPTPLIFPLGTGSGDGVMLRGGFSINPKINLNYATYFSTLSTVNKFESDRAAGGRLGLFLPGPRIEAGVSFQKELQDERSNAFGFHFAWQPAAVPLNLRSEYARSHDGSGYWIEAAYRLSQAPFWQKAMRRTEIVGRGQQLFAGQISEAKAEEYGLPDVNTRQGDFGLNYYIRDGLKASASYSRRFNSDGNVNLWTVGLAYRFALPLGRVGPQ
jgi:hypothetical protein